MWSVTLTSLVLAGIAHARSADLVSDYRRAPRRRRPGMGGFLALIIGGIIGALAHYLAWGIPLAVAWWTDAGLDTDSFWLGLAGLIGAAAILQRSLAHQGATLHLERLIRSTMPRTWGIVGGSIVGGYLLRGLDLGVVVGAGVWAVLGFHDHLAAAGRKARVASQVAAVLGISDEQLGRMNWSADTERITVHDLPSTAVQRLPDIRSRMVHLSGWSIDEATPRRVVFGPLTAADARSLEVREATGGMVEHMEGAGDVEIQPDDDLRGVL